MKKLFYVFILFSLIVFQNAAVAEDTIKKSSPEIKAMRSITAAECLEHVSFLAGDECNGRGPASEGFDLAAEYIAEQFAEMGLKPAVNGESYYQEFTIDRNFLGEENALELQITLPQNDTLFIQYDMEKDFLPVRSAKNVEINSDLVFAGYGITSPDNDWDDYADIDVKGKIVLVLRGVPPIEDADFGRMFSLRYKTRFAMDAGAVGLLVVGNPIGSISYKQNIPAVVIRESVGNDMLKGSGYDIDTLKEKIKDEQKPLAMALPHRVRLTIDSELVQDQVTANIAGYIEGSDPKLKDEFIVVGAHADHVGQIGDLTFYGANDNASGTSTVMEIAEAFATADTLPRRSVLFIAFSGEEMGLLGSKYYCEHPLFDIKKTKAMINLDMVGIGDDAFMIVGGHTYPDFAKIYDACSEKYVQIPIRRRWTSSNSDHYPFHEVGVPSVFMYTIGEGPSTYHTPRDLPDTLDPEVMESVGRLNFGVIWKLANMKKVSFKYVENKNN